MRILLLGDINSPHLVRWANGLHGLGFTVGIFTMEKPLMQVLREPGIWSWSSASGSSGSSLGKLAYFSQVRALKKCIAEFRPQIVHAHYASSYGMLGRRSGFKPYFISVWGSDVLKFPLSGPFQRLILQRNLNSASRLFATSSFLAAATGRFTRTPIVTIPFGVDTDKFSPSGISKTGASFTIGTLKSLSANYGIDILIRAFAALPRHNTISLRLVIGGDGPDREKLIGLSKELGVGDKCEFAGRIPHDKAPDFLRSLDLFANLSYSESFGVAVIEAMACGVPVIATATGGLPDIVRHESTGLLVEPGHVEATTSAISRMILDEKSRISMAGNALDMVRKEYEWKNCLETMARHYRAFLPAE